MKRFIGVSILIIILAILSVGIGTAFLCVEHVFKLDTKINYTFDKNEIPKNALNIKTTTFTITDKEVVAKKYDVEEHIYGLMNDGTSVHFTVSDEQYAKLKVGETVTRVKYEIEPTLSETLSISNISVASVFTLLIGVIIVFFISLFLT